MQTEKKMKQTSFLKKCTLAKKEKEPCSQRVIVGIKVKTSNMILSKSHLWVLDVKIL